MKYDDFIKMNEASSELALLSNLYSFYLQKYGEDKTKFKEQVNFLQEQGEISKKSVTKFFKENGITTPTYLSAGVKVTTKSGSAHSDNGCGSDQSVGCGSISPKTNFRSYDNGCGSSKSGC